MEHDTIRLDKWLWYGRFFKSRSMAAEVAVSGRTRVNGNRVSKASFAIRAGDVITFVQARRVRVVEVLSVGERRGPAAEAQLLYREIED